MSEEGVYEVQMSEVWEVAQEVHRALDKRLEETRAGVKEIHQMLQDALTAFEKGDFAESNRLMRAALDKEFELFAECECVGNDELLTYLKYDPNQDDPFLGHSDVTGDGLDEPTP